MIRKILIEPNPILRQRSKDVDLAAISSRKIQAAIQDLKDTLETSENGIGIAAPQIGVSLRIFVVSEEAKFIGGKNPPKEKHWKHCVYINPVIVKSSRKKADAAEGCLSVPKKYGIVTRPEKVEIEAYDEAGRKFSQGASKFYARVLQHEMDHLGGILFIDKVKRFIDVPREKERR